MLLFSILNTYIFHTVHSQHRFHVCHQKKKKAIKKERWSFSCVSLASDEAKLLPVTCCQRTMLCAIHSAMCCSALQLSSASSGCQGPALPITAVICGPPWTHPEVCRLPCPGPRGCHTLGHFQSFNWRRQWHPTPVLLPGKSHGQRSLVGCSPWDH